MLIILLILIFIRPFISSLAFPCLNFLYSALLIIFFIAWIIYRGLSFQKIKTLKIPLILFSLALIISTMFSINKLNSLNELLKYITYLSIFLIIPSLTNEEKIRLIQTIVVAGLIISLLAIYQYLFGFRHLLDYLQKHNITDVFALDYISSQRVFFPFVTPNALGGYLIMIIPLVFINKKRGWLILPLSLALLLTRSLGALLSLFLALTVYLYLQGKPGRQKMFFLFGLLVTIGVVFIIRSATQKQHLQPIFSTLMRLNYWKETWKIIKGAPLTGVGLGNFNLPFSRYAHNSYLQIWAEMGIFGITGLLGMIFIFLKRALKLKLNEDLSQMCLISAAAAFLFHNLMDFSFFIPEVALNWWVILGLIESKV